jgi:hypothetical protein
LISSLQQTRRKRATNPAIDDVLSITQTLYDQFTANMNELNTSIAQVDKMIVEIRAKISASAATACDSINPILNVNSFVTKKVCLITNSYNRNDAENFCKMFGMNGLYAVTSALDYAQLTVFLNLRLTVLLVTFNNYQLYIDGVQAGNTTWYNYNPTATLLATTAIPSTGSGGFLKIQGSNGPVFSTISALSSGNSWFVCEFEP